jgi:hypothetical protein
LGLAYEVERARRIAAVQSRLSQIADGGRQHASGDGVAGMALDFPLLDGDGPTDRFFGLLGPPGNVEPRGEIAKKLSQNQSASGFVPGSVGPPVASATLCARSSTDGTDPTAGTAP